MWLSMPDKYQGHPQKWMALVFPDGLRRTFLEKIVKTAYYY